MPSQIPVPPGGDQRHGYILLVPAIIIFILSALAVVARLYVRLHIRPKLGWDDYTMFAAFFITCFGLACAILQVKNGIGRHVYYLSPEQIVEARKWGQLGELQTNGAIALVKVSICLFLLRILDRARKEFRQFIWILMVFSLAGNIALIITWFLQCIPLNALWNPTVHGKCIPGAALVAVVYVGTAFNAITDLICALLPIFFFHNSHMKKRMKGVLIFLASLGILTSLASFLKMLYIPELAAPDTTWAVVNVTTCAILEQYASIFLASLPAVKPLYNKAFELAQSVQTGSKPSAHAWHELETPKNNSRGTASSDRIPLEPSGIMKTTDLETSVGTIEESNHKAETKHGFQGVV